jgi:hypothetical protein
LAQVPSAEAVLTDLGKRSAAADRVPLPGSPPAMNGVDLRPTTDDGDRNRVSIVDLDPGVAPPVEPVSLGLAAVDPVPGSAAVSTEDGGSPAAPVPMLRLDHDRTPTRGVVADPPVSDLVHGGTKAVAAHGKHKTATRTRKPGPARTVARADTTKAASSDPPRDRAGVASGNPFLKTAGSSQDTGKCRKVPTGGSETTATSLPFLSSAGGACR